MDELSAMSFDETLSRALRLHQAGQTDAAEALYRELLAEAPEHAPLLYAYGVLEMQRQRAEAGSDLLERAATAAPERADYRLRLGIAQLSLSRLEAAIASFEAALALGPSRGEAALAAFYLGQALRAARRIPEALARYRQALRIWEAAPEAGRPRALMAQAYYQSGRILSDVRQIGPAREALLAASRLQPDLAAIWQDLAEVLLRHGRPEDAYQAYQKAQALDPQNPVLASSALYCLLHLPEIPPDARQAAFRRVGELLAMGRPLPPRPLPRPGWPRRLRIGYLGSNLRQHSSAATILPLYRDRNREAFELYSYASLGKADAGSLALKCLSDRWYEVLDWSDAQLAEQIRADGIDILVDLNGHTLAHRLACFALRPAPVQLTGLSFGADSGLAAIDYRLADTCLVPPEQQELQADRIWYLPLAFCYAPPEDAPAPQPAPRHANGFITFGSGNGLYKLNEQVLACWAEILHACPGSRLRLKTGELGDPGVQADLRARFAAAGVDPGRIDLLGHSLQAEHLAFYNSLDLALDPFPYDGGVTTCEALWMGVPVLSLNRFPGQRAGVTLLSRLGLADWLATSLADYVARGLRLAADGQALDALRFSLRHRLAASPICDAQAYTRSVEAAYREIWAATWVKL